MPNVFDKHGDKTIQIAYCSFAYCNGSLINDLLLRGKRF